MASVIDTIVGQPLWLWKDTIGKPHTAAITSGSATIHDVFTDRWAIHAGTAGTSNLRITPIGGGAALDVSIVATDALGVVATKSIVNIGDSGTTDSGYPKIIKDLLGADITLLGTQGVTFIHEGYPGKDWDWIRNHADSPLTSATNTLDLAAFETSLGATPDIYTLSFGSNDVFSLTNDGTSAATITATIDQAISDARDVVTAIRAQNATAHIGLFYTFPGALLESTWKTAYPNPTFADPLRNGNWVPIIREFWAAMKTEFEGEEASDVHLIPTHLRIDTGPVLTGAYPTNDPFHFDIIKGHPEIGKAVVAWMVANW